MILDPFGDGLPAERGPIGVEPTEHGGIGRRPKRVDVVHHQGAQIGLALQEVAQGAVFD